MFIGLDLGTSGLRALLVGSDGAVRGLAEAHYGVSHPHDGWSEQDPADWINACKSVLAELAKARPKEMAALQGVAFSGHMHGATVLDADGAVLRPCILWNDTRSHVEAAALDKADNVREISGNIVFPGFTAPKLTWMARCEPDLFGQVAMVLLPKDYLVFWLTGQRVSEMSDAAGTSWLDTGARAWSDTTIKASGMRPDQMPALVEGNAVVGEIRADIAEILGLPRGVQVVAGGADNAAAACGVGTMGEGEAFVSLGTSGVMLAGRNRYAPAPDSAVHTFCHAVPDRWYQMGVVLAATDNLNWLAGITGQSPQTLTAALGEDIKTPGPLRFFPYLSGERTPHNDSVIRAGFAGVGAGSDAKSLTKAVMEGVCFALRDSYEALKSTGVELASALAIGGGTRSTLWTKMLSTALDLPLERPAQGEFGAAMGAARLAISGVTGVTPQDIMTKPKIAEKILPDADLRLAFEDAYHSYKNGYSHLKALQ